MPTRLAYLLLSTALIGCPSKSNKEPVQPAGGGQVATVKAVLSLGTKGSIGVQSRIKGDTWQSMKVGQGLEPGAWLRTSKGTRGKLELADGSTLLLNQETQLQLRETRALEVRQGELLARVEPAKDRPLSIETPAGKVSITGTKLNLQVGKDQTVVDVTRGTVVVEGAGAKVEVGAGERAVVRPGERPRVSLSQDLVRVTSWSREIGEPTRAVEQLQEGFGSLTARAPGQGGGRPLRLAEQQVRVTIRDNIARTEVEQVYYNPSGQTLEGTYRFPLPGGASIARLALYVGNKLMEGEVVERHRARRIFNQIVNDTIRPRDPALLEWMGGRTFRMKIFPIPPRGSRRVILAYVQPLKASYGRYRYVYPMSTSKGKATRVGRFSIDMRVSGTRGVSDVEAPLYPVLKERDNEGVRLRYEASDFTPAASFVANYKPEGQTPEMQVALYEKKDAKGALACALPGADQRALKVPVCGDHGGFFMAVLRPELPLEGRAKRRDYLFLMDSSYGTGKEGWAVQLRALEAFLSEMDLSSRINVMACDERCRVMGPSFREPNSEVRKQALAFAGGITPGGASNIQGAFEEAARHARATDHPVHVVYMGDGRPTAGEMREPQLARLTVDALGKAGVSLSVLQIGEDVGELFLEEATRKLAGSIHRLEAGDDLRTRVFEVVAAQYRPTLTNLQVGFEGVEVHHVYPETLPSLVAGAEVVVTGRYDRPGGGSVRLTGTVDGRPFERRYPIQLAASPEERGANSFVPRLWAKDHLDALSVSDYTGNRPEIVRVSQEYSVLSRATAFLVLENERMYREFNVKRRGNRDYWKGDKVASRTLRDSADAPATTASKDEERTRAEAEKTPLVGGKAEALSGASGAGRMGSLAATESRKAKRGAPMPDLANPFDADDGAPEAKARPAAEPEATAAPPPRPAAQAPAKEIARSRPMPKPRPSRRARRKLDRKAMDTLDGLGGGGGYYRRPPPRPVTVTNITPILDVELSAAQARREQSLEQQVASHPLRRNLRRAYQRVLVRDARYEQALRHAETWAELDGSHPGAILALADMQAATGKLQEAMRTYSASVEVQPWNTRLHRDLAQMYRQKGELARSCAHLWSIMSIQPERLEHHLALTRCLAQLPEGKAVAMQLLAELSKSPLGKSGAHAARIGQALARLAAGTETGDADRASRGALVLKATWDKPVDLDLALVTPGGQRLTTLRTGRRGSATDSRDGRTAEQLALRWMGNGSYRVEVAPASASASAGTVSGTLLITAHGKSRAVPFVVSGRSKPVARIDQTTRYRR